MEIKNKPVNHDRTHYNLLVKHAKQEGLKVVKAHKKLYDFAGMNPQAARELHFKNIKKKEILIDPQLPLHKRVRNLRHELIEYHDMTKGKDYFPAHKIALRKETKMTEWEKETKKR